MLFSYFYHFVHSFFFFFFFFNLLGRGKRKLDNADSQIMKKPKIEQDLNAIEASTTAIITIDDSGVQQESFGKSSELYKVLKQPVMDSKITNSSGKLIKVDKKIIEQKKW